MTPSTPTANRPFQARLHRARKRRAAGEYAQAAFLHAHAARDLMQRLEAIKRPFERVLTLGAAEVLAEARARATFAVAADVEAALLSPGGVALDPEALVFAPEQFDLILAPLTLAWVNDLPGALVQLRAALRPDGLLLATLYGPDTLLELRGCLLQAEADLTGGASLRIAPFPELREAASLLQRAGFALTTADRDRLRVRYADPLGLLADLRAMGETAALREPARPLRRDVVMRAMTLYAERHADPDGRIPATVELITLTGWAPHASQQQPLRPGSAKARLADALNTEERTAGEKAHGPARQRPQG